MRKLTGRELHATRGPVVGTYCFKKYWIAAGCSGSNGWARVKRERTPATNDIFDSGHRQYEPEKPNMERKHMNSDKAQWHKPELTTFISEVGGGKNITKCFFLCCIGAHCKQHCSCQHLVYLCHYEQTVLGNAHNSGMSCALLSFDVLLIQQAMPVAVFSAC